MVDDCTKSQEGVFLQRVTLKRRDKQIVPNPKKGSFYSVAAFCAVEAAIVPNPKKGSFYS